MSKISDYRHMCAAIMQSMQDDGIPEDVAEKRCNREITKVEEVLYDLLERKLSKLSPADFKKFVTLDYADDEVSPLVTDFFLGLADTVVSIEAGYT